MPNLYDHTDYRTYLRQWYDEENARREADGRARLSHRRLAELLGTRTSSTLLNILNLGRPLTPELAHRFSEVLGLAPPDLAYLLLLIEVEQAGLRVARANSAVHRAGAPSAGAPLRQQRRAMAAQSALHTAEAELARTREAISAVQARERMGRLARDRMALLSTWVCAAILELARCEGFQADPAWMVSALRGRASAEEVLATLALLRGLGVLKEDGQVHTAPLATASEVPAGRVRRWYEGVSALSAAAVRDHFDATEPGFQQASRLGGLTVAVPTAHIPRLKARLAEVQDELHQLAEALPGPRDRVVQLYLHLFPLSLPTTDLEGRGEPASTRS